MNREGIGDILADGVKVLLKKSAKGLRQYAVHIGGQELGMHDPKLRNGTVTRGCHARKHATKWMPHPAVIRLNFGPFVFIDTHSVNITGMCHFWQVAGNEGSVVGFFNAVTGWNLRLNDMIKAGERVAI